MLIVCVPATTRASSGEMYPGGVKCDVQIFTYIGPILVSCNPYKGLPIFNDEFIKLYYNKVRAHLHCAPSPAKPPWRACPRAT